VLLVALAFVARRASALRHLPRTDPRQLAGPQIVSEQGRAWSWRTPAGPLLDNPHVRVSYLGM
jgi:hypothetical protein